MKKLIFVFLICFCMCSCYHTYNATIDINYTVAYNDSTLNYNESYDYSFNYPGTRELKEYYKNPSKFANNFINIKTYSINGTNYLDLVNTHNKDIKHIFSSTAHVRLNSYNINIK